MTRTKIEPGLHFWLHGREYVVKKRLASGEFQICDFVTSVTSKVSSTALIQFLFRGELEIELMNQGEKSKNHKQINADFTQIPESSRLEAKRKYSYISSVLELDNPTLTQATLQPVIERVSSSINDPLPPTWLTLYRWLKTYSSSGQDIRALVPKHSSKGDYRPKLEPEVIKIIDRAIESIYLNTSQPDVMDVYNEIICSITPENQTRAVIGQKPLEIPHRSTIYRIISKLEPLTVATGRYGKRVAAQMYDPVLLGPRPTRPLERVEIDHTKLPLFVVDTDLRMPIGRPWLTSAVDKYSGITLGYYISFEPPSYLSVMQCLLHLISPKNYLHTKYPSVENTWDTYGLPEVIVVDNGKEFYSTHFEDACLQLGITIQYCPPKMPWYKSAIERYFGALNSQLISEQPGKTFSNFMKQYDYDPLKNAVISFEALQEIMHIFIVDIHNQSSHSSFKSPRAQVWSKAITVFPPALPTSYQDLKILIGSITTRKISRRGVELFGIIYNNAELASLRSSGKFTDKTTVKYDPSDLSKIYVFDSTTHRFQEVPALNQEYTTGLTLWQHQVIKQLARIESEQVDIVALALAKEKIQRIVERESILSKKSKTSTAIARWKGIGKNNFSLKDLESSQQPQSENHSLVVFDTLSNTSQVITGISDLGTAFNNDIPSQRVDDNIQAPEIKSVNHTNIPSDLEKETTTTNLSKRKRSGRRKSTTSITKCKCSQSLIDCKPQFLQSAPANLALHIYKLCQVAELKLGETKNLSQSNPIMLLDLNRLVSLLYFLVDFSRIPYIQDKFLSRLKSQLELFNSGCYFDIAFSILTNWKHEFLSFMSSYEDYLKRTYNSRDLIPQKFQDILKLFRSIVDCFPGESYRFIQSVIEDYFWQILEKISLKKIQISWQKPFQSLSSVSTGIQHYHSLISRVATELNFKELTLAQLFIWSQIEIHEDTIFFKIAAMLP